MTSKKNQGPFLPRNIGELQAMIDESLENGGTALVAHVSEKMRGDGDLVMYTVGQTQKKRYELIVTGLPPHVAVPLIDAIVQMKEDPEVFMPILESPDKKIKVMLLPLPSGVVRDNMLVTISRFPLDKITACQVCWSDCNNKFPWEEGYEESKFKQPLLGRTATKE